MCLRDFQSGFRTTVQLRQYTIWRHKVKRFVYIWIDSDADVDGGGGGERTQWNVSSDRLYSLGEMKPGDR